LHRPQGQSGGRRLSFNELPSHSVHRHAASGLVERRYQPDNLDIGLSAQTPEHPSAVFAGAPRDQNALHGLNLSENPRIGEAANLLRSAAKLLKHGFEVGYG
jgi:hypothetical protein